MPAMDNHGNKKASQPEDAFEEVVRGLLSQIAEVMEVRRLDQRQRGDVLRLEEEAESSGAASGLIMFVNEGVKQALESDLVFVASTGPMHRDPPQPWTMMMDEEDKVIGEWLPESRLEEARQSGRCIFLSEDFVMYKDRRPVGPSRFVMPFICLPVDRAPGLAVCGIGSPSGPADEYVRHLLGNPGQEIATLLVGISLNEHADPDGEE